MIKDTLQKIEDTVRSAPQATAETKQELLSLVRELSAELEALERTHATHARTIAGKAELAAIEAARGRSEPPGPPPARADLTASVSEFEATHPKLASLVRSIADALANVGI